MLAGRAYSTAMSSGTPELPEVFHLEGDPFPQFRIRDVLFSVGDSLSRAADDDPPVWNDTRVRKSLRDIDRELAIDFAEIAVQRYAELPSEEIQMGYLSLWSLVARLCEYHRLEAKYAMGQEQPDPGSLDEQILNRRIGIYQEDKPEDVESMLRRIDGSNYPALFNDIAKSELEKLDVLVTGAGLGHKIRIEERRTGLCYAIADAQLLVLQAKAQIPTSQRL